jgi:hypothetical protein
VVYRGRYRLDEKTQVLTGDVLGDAGFGATPVMDKALFLGRETERSDRFDLALGQFFLDETSHAILDGLHREWGRLDPIPPEGFLRMQWNDCAKKPFLLKLNSDIHGRWLLLVENVGMHAGGQSSWISAVSKNGNSLELTLEDYYGGTRREVFKLPEDRKDVAYLGSTAYSFKFHRYPTVRHRCLEGGP